MRLGTSASIRGRDVPVLWGAAWHGDRAGGRRSVAAGPDSARGTCGQCGPNLRRLPVSSSISTPRCRLRELADGPERAGDFRPLHARRHSGSVSPDRGTGAGAGLRPRLPIHGGRSRLPGPDQSYDPAFLDELRHFRFTGEILAMPEGRRLRRRAPAASDRALPRALLLESGLHAGDRPRR